MRTIIAGSRSITDLAVVEKAVKDSGFAITEVVSGGARGVDRLGEKLANDCGLPCAVFPAEWKRYGKRAGFLRNSQMAEYAEALVAVWDGKSRGTAHMVSEAKDRGLRVYIHREEDE